MAIGEDLSQAAGRGVEVELNGKKWKLSPLTMGDLAEFQSHLHGKKLGKMKELLRELAPAEKLQAIGMAVGDSVTEDEMEREMTTFEGVRFVLWRCVRRSHPELTLEQAGDLFSMQDRLQLLEAIRQISGMAAENPTAKGGQATP